MVSVLLGLAVLEYRRHQNRILAIPHRIHVNGTRGKSSVTRLIGAGLRAGGIKTLTKVTGSFPRLILADGSDVPVHRKAAPSILEQLDIVRFAHRQGVEALVIECMALYPENQRITEHQMIHATVPVLVNVRLDHTDIMGRTLAEVGATMAHTFPSGSRVLTAESDHLDLVQRLGRERGAWIEPVSVDEAQPEDLAGFRLPRASGKRRPGPGGLPTPRGRAPSGLARHVGGQARRRGPDPGPGGRRRCRVHVLQRVRRQRR